MIHNSEQSYPFSRACGRVPRVLLSSASNTEWFKFLNQFKGAIRDDESMKMRLAASLKEFVEEDSLFEDVGEKLKI